MSRRIIVGLAVLVASALQFSTACTPEQVQAFLDSSPDQQTAIMAALQRPAADKFSDAISEDGLARLRACESGGNYGAIGGGGSFRGAYQFTRQTWNGTAGRFYPELHGVDPALAAPHDQDRMARALWANGGPRNWPVCSRRV